MDYRSDLLLIFVSDVYSFLEHAKEQQREEQEDSSVVDGSDGTSNNFFLIFHSCNSV